ncbi:hypothetical protein SCHPADRAFT_793919, partial [Schizopora paradoxa]
KRSVYRILADWKRTGEVKVVSERKQGRPRALDFADTQVVINTVTNRNDMYLQELQQVL